MFVELVVVVVVVDDINVLWSKLKLPSTVKLPVIVSPVTLTNLLSASVSV